MRNGINVETNGILRKYKVATFNALYKTLTHHLVLFEKFNSNRLSIHHTKCQFRSLSNFTAYYGQIISICIVGNKILA